MKALVVEDDRSLRTLVTIFLKRLGFAAEGAENGSDALEKTRKNNYDLIMTDMDMPQLNGMELYLLVAKEAPHLLNRFIFATGNTCNDTYNCFFKRIQRPVLVKPFSLSELEKTINRVIAKRPVLRQHVANS